MLNTHIIYTYMLAYIVDNLYDYFNRTDANYQCDINRIHKLKQEKE